MKEDQTLEDNSQDDTFKKSWTLENALQVLQHPTVDSKTWAEAVEWLVLYGPLEIQKLLLVASGQATSSCFPDLKTQGCTAEGSPCYNVADIAKVLGIDAEEAAKILAEKEQLHGVQHGFDESEVTKVQ